MPRSRQQPRSVSIAYGPEQAECWPAVGKNRQALALDPQLGSPRLRAISNGHFNFAHEKQKEVHDIG